MARPKENPSAVHDKITMRFTHATHPTGQTQAAEGLAFEDGMGLTETSVALALCLLALAAAVVLDRRPYRPGKRNFIALMIIALAASLVLARHLLTLVL
jgi:hypothetical protein